MEESKRPWFSKRVWLGIITAIAPFIPGVSAWVSAHLELVGIVWGGLATVIGVLSKHKITLTD